MNDKRAKAARRTARVLARTMKVPKLAYQFNQRTRVIRVAPQCERGIYLGLKKGDQ